MRSLVRCLLSSAVGILLSVASRADPPTLQQGPDAALYDLAAREAQYQALAAIPGVEVQYDKYGRVRQVDGPTGIYVPEAAKLKPGDSVDALFQKFKQILLASGTESLVVRESGPVLLGSDRFLFTEQAIAVYLSWTFA